MKRMIITNFSLLVLMLFAFQTYAQDPITVATFEDEDGIDYAELNTWPGATDTVANPVTDGINTSATCARFIKTEAIKDGSIMEFTGFKIPHSIYTNPEFKLKIMSPDTSGVAIKISLYDYTGAGVSKSINLPEGENEWHELTYNFEEFLSSSSIGYITSMKLWINSNNTTGYDQTFYVDDLTITGENAALTESDVVILFQETFANNAWWMKAMGNGYYVSKDSTLAELRTTAWGGSALSASTANYNGEDSLVLAMTNWSARGVGQLDPSSTRPTLSSFTIRDIGIAGKANMSLSYDLYWLTAPSAFTDAPTFELSVDGGGWTEIQSTSELPTKTKSWKAGIEFDLSTVSGTKLSLRITNNTSGICHFDEIKLKGTSTFAGSISIAGDTEITTKGGTVQLSSTILPESAEQAAYWYVSDGIGNATVNSLTGEVSALKDGEVTVTAIAIDKTGLAQASHMIAISNQHPVDSVTITSVDDVNIIDVAAGSLQLSATVYPEFASNPEIVWSLDGTAASIDQSGLLTAISNGAVDVIATAAENSAVADTFEVTITNQSTALANTPGLENIKIYPVPASDQLHITNMENVERIDVLDINGQLIKSIENNAVNTTINVSELSNGIYYLRMQNSNGVVTRKFVK
ncbi:Ig-like domain-containing protein [Geofilum sp. OHC36d9]|uniref:Ig-like domain-containing protein n=1 Tax=Geofilum sp. OHC36d9 TaxID=3458413 RepID=UPI004033504C